MEAVISAKLIPAERRAGLVEDVERGFKEGIEPLPWQTDTCIGDWHYNRALFDNHRYKSAQTVIHRLCDIVSKNGNLLLSIPVRGDGSIDSDERAVLESLAEWMARNGEAIHGTRPWRKFGEGPTQVAGGMFSEGQGQSFTAEDVRFTTKGGALYAIALGSPRFGPLRIRSLAQGSALAPGEVAGVQILGVGAVPFARNRKGLEVQVPEGLAGAPAIVVKILGQGLV